ncbi:MAG: winged helix-turn-helix domain-containing protein [Bacillota bacterium]
MAGETILVVDDDEDIREVIKLYLEKEGYCVISALDGNQAILKAFNCDPHLIILDMMLPGLDGIEVCQEIRKNSNTPIIFLSCKGAPLDKSMGLTAGGDDYMSKPFEAVELLARVKAHLRRSRMLQNTYKDTANTIIKYSGLTIDLPGHSVEVNGQPIILSPKEFQLLAVLARNPNKVFSSEELFNMVWETESYGDNRTIMVHISNIRKKIEKNPINPLFIHTVKGVGYKFSVS